MKRIAVTGARGQLGREFMSIALPHYGRMGFDRQSVDLTNPDTYGPIKKYRPDIIINCAAYTNVDAAETEREQAELVNAIAPGHLGELAKQLDATLVHVSTDYVFNGQTSLPYRESDQPDPINFYGQTKLMGERLVIDSGCRHIIARTALLYGQDGPNFILTMLKLGKERDVVRVVDDQVGSPTYTKDLCRQIIGLLDQDAAGTFHCVNSGAPSRYEVVSYLYAQAGVQAQVEPASSISFPSAAARPAYSALCTERTSRIVPIRAWQEGIYDYLVELQT